jgi:hypothetical protein
VAGVVGDSKRFALDPERLVSTVTRLEERIAARFPNSGLSNACGKLREIAGHAGERAAIIAQPNMTMRFLIALVLVVALVLLTVLCLAVMSAINLRGDNSFSSIIQGIDAGFNIAILLGASLLFMGSLESRMKRARALEDVHELRAMVHVIDMHQLTKDPSATIISGPATAASPQRTLTPFELMRYLDYCSEMLALTGKIAALYAHSSRDAVVIATVNELEQLVASMSLKIWQKIGIVVGSGQTTVKETV